MITSTYIDHATYGGSIYKNDYDTEFGNTKNMASRIAADARLDKKFINYLNLKKLKKAGK